MAHLLHRRGVPHPSDQASALSSGPGSSAPPVVFVCQPADPSRVALLHFLRARGLSLRTAAYDEALEVIDAVTPEVAVVDAARGAGMQVLSRLRDRASTASLPTVALIGAFEERAVYGALYAGADEVVPSPACELLIHHCGAMRCATTSEAEVRPKVVVAARDADHRRRLGLCLRRAGYDVHFVADLSEVYLDAVAGAARFCVATDEVLAGRRRPDDVVLSHVASRCPIVVSSADVARERLWLDGIGARVRVVDARALPDVLLHTAHEAVHGDELRRRARPRTPHGALFEFRAPGAPSWIPAVTLDVSSAGARVRTALPPSIGAPVEVRVKPTAEPRWLTLQGRVAWRAPFRLAGAGIPSPPGFGLDLTDARVADRTLWTHACAQLQRALAGPRPGGVLLAAS